MPPIYKTTFSVNIVDPRPKVTGIYIDTMPNKKEYGRKESLDLTGLVVKATYTDGSQAVVAAEDYTVKGYNALQLGTQTITITYKEFTATFAVTVSSEPTQPTILYGDVNGDGTVNNLDRVILTRHLANWADYTDKDINKAAADVNGDGNVNNLDRVILTRHLANWEGYETLPIK